MIIQASLSIDSFIVPYIAYLYVFNELLMIIQMFFQVGSMLRQGFVLDRKYSCE